MRIERCDRNYPVCTMYLELRSFHSGRPVNFILSDNNDTWSLYTGEIYINSFEDTDENIKKVVEFFEMNPMSFYEGLNEKRNNKYNDIIKEVKERQRRI